VRRLIFWGQTDVAWRSIHLSEISPWLDLRIIPVDAVLNRLEAQQHRRFLKTHLALDGLPYYPQVKYIVVGRDARDVFMSWHNHFVNFSDDFAKVLNETPGRVGPPNPMPAYANDLHEFWRNWITRGWFAWESEGYPAWGNMRHTQTWWDYRHLDNILFVHYNDLLTDLPNEMRHIAAFLDIPLSDEMLAEIVPDISLASLRRASVSDPMFKLAFKDGAQTFFFKGTNGRWHNVLSDDELAMYEATAARVLMPECRAWLEQGRVALASQPLIANSQGA
jgi:aryl sulfotransferase